MITTMTTNRKRQLKGVVVSDKMEKTRVVAVARLKRHAKYPKYFRVTVRMKAHDEKNEYKVGDEVVIEETRPLSKEKRWVIVGKAQSAKREA
jgi:small subunit ribosomal protein S17